MVDESQAKRITAGAVLKFLFRSAGAIAGGTTSALIVSSAVAVAHVPADVTVLVIASAGAIGGYFGFAEPIRAFAGVIGYAPFSGMQGPGA